MSGKSSYPTYEIESLLMEQEGFKFVVGTDEAGRGSLAGPVVAAAVHIPLEVVSELLGKVNDSKKIRPKRREELCELIKATCSYGIQDISAEIIDEINILEATKLAMKSSVEQLEYFDYILIDGTVDLKKHIICPQKQVIKGDALSLSIAAASILAKVTRDRMMLDLHELFPIYGFDEHKGYGTKKHIEAIQLYGASDYHRFSFRKVGK